MASGIQTTISANASAFDREMDRVARAAIKNGRIMQAALTGTAPNATLQFASRLRHEAAVAEYQERLERKAAGYARYRLEQYRAMTDEAKANAAIQDAGLKHARAWGGASSAMFVSVARDTAASLASGANPITVFMQQFPQVMQAFIMMGKEGFAALKESLATGLSKLVSGMGGKTGVALAAVGGVALYETLGEEYKMFQALYEAAKTEKNVMNGLRQQRADMLKFGRELAEKSAWKKFGEFQELLTNAPSTPEGLWSALNKARRMLPRQQTEKEKADFQEVADQMRVLGIEAETDPAKKLQLRAELERDRSLRQVPEMAKKSGIPEADIRAAIERVYQANIADTSNNFRKSGARGLNMLTDWERAGGSLGANNLMLDVSKAQLNELRQINQKLTGNRRGVRF